MDSLSLTPEHQKAILAFDALREAIPVAEQVREDLLYQRKPELESRYYKKVGSTKLRLLSLRTTLFSLRREMEMIQAHLNQNKPVLIEVIRILVEAEMKELKAKIEEEAKKIEQLMLFASAPLLDADSLGILRKIYYKLSKRLHPDLNPGLSETEKDLWLQVSEAYRNGDLQRMEMLDILIGDNPGTNYETPSSLAELNRRIEKMQRYLDKLNEEILHIQTLFPFSIAENLEDPKWVEEENEKTDREIAAVEAETKAYREAINKLLSGTAT